MHSSLCILVAVAFLSPFAATQYEDPGPYAPGWQDAFLSDGTGTFLRVRMHYPSQGGGAGSPVDSSDGPYPLIVFGHGLGARPLAYQDLLNHFASWGYFILAPDTYVNGPQASLADDMDTAYDIAQVLATPGGSLANMVRLGDAGVMGHSMGAGSAIQAAAAEPGLRWILALAPWNNPDQPRGEPAPSQAMALTDAPLQIIVGELDHVTPVESDALPIYLSANDQQHFRVLSVVFGAGHATGARLSFVSRQSGVAFFERFSRDEHAALDVVYGPSAQASPLTELTYEITQPDLFITGTGQAGTTVAATFSGPEGHDALGAVAAAIGPGTGAIPCLGLDLASLTVIMSGVFDASQMITLVGLLPDGKNALPPGTVYLQALSREPGGDWECSDVRALTLTP